MDFNNIKLSKETPFYIINHYSPFDKKARVGFRAYYLYQKLKEEGWNVKLILPMSNEKEVIVVKEGVFIKLIKPFLRIFPPDNSIAWSLKVFLYLKKNNKNNKFMLLTSSPPYSIGLIGLYCKWFCKKAIWIADYRDLWTKNKLYKPPITKKYFNPILERKYLKNADLVVLNTEWDLKLNQNIFPFIKNKSIYMRNGFAKRVKNKSIIRNKLIYSGGTYRGLATRGVIILLKKLNEQGADIVCDFYGEYDPYMANQKYINYCGSVASETVPELLAKYKIGLIYLPKNCEKGGVVAQKFYDYLGSGLYPICINASIETKKIMDDLNIGLSFNEDDLIKDNEKLVKEILNFIQNAEFNDNLEKVANYSRDRQFEYLLHQIENRIFEKIL